MKKVIICFVLTFVLLFSGCSCSKKSKLAFDTNWLNTNLNYSKNYNVNLEDYSDGTYNYSIKNKDSYGNISMNGTYNLTVNTVNLDEANSLIDDEFRKTLTDGNLYKITTKLELDVIYSGVSSEPYKDYVETSAYFFGKNLIPIYSLTKNKYSYLGLINDKLQVTQLEGEDEIKYTISTYTVNRKIKNLDTDDQEEMSEQYDYQMNTIVDNSYLLFAIQNTEIKEKDSTKTLPVISATYGEEKNITVRYYEDKNTEIKSYSFMVEDGAFGCFGGNTGKAQILKISTIDGQNVFTEYASPLTSYDNNYTCFGALVYRLIEE